MGVEHIAELSTREDKDYCVISRESLVVGSLLFFSSFFILSFSGLCPTDATDDVPITHVKDCECIGAIGKYCDTLVGSKKNSATRIIGQTNLLTILSMLVLFAFYLE